MMESTLHSLHVISLSSLSPLLTTRKRLMTGKVKSAVQCSAVVRPKWIDCGVELLRTYRYEGQPSLTL